MATGLGGSKAGKVTGAAVAALGGAAVAVATTVTARVTESAARHGLGPRPKEAASDRITAANVLAPVVDGAPDAAEVERLVGTRSHLQARHVHLHCLGVAVREWQHLSIDGPTGCFASPTLLLTPDRGTIVVTISPGSTHASCMHH